MLRWFRHVERMDERRLTKKIYEVDVGGNAGRGKRRLTFLDQIGEVLEKGQVKSTLNRRACLLLRVWFLQIDVWMRLFCVTKSMYEEFDDSGRSEKCV
jgi:hypothetical protein